jgi:hypothetical protein
MMLIEPSILNKGGMTASCLINPPNLPAGLTFDADTCKIFGTPTQIALPQIYTVTMTNTLGTATAPLTFGVLPVVRIAEGGVDVSSGASDLSGLTTVTQPALECGTTGTIADRVADCQTKNSPAAELHEASSPPKYWWTLVTRTATGETVWRDNITGLIWSDVISTGANWCHASGSNNKSGSPLAELDSVGGVCDNVNHQSQDAPISLCAEDATNLNGTLASHPAKGGLGKLSGATTVVTWWLPSIEDFRKAHEHGAAKVLPEWNLRFWSASVFSYDRFGAWQFYGSSGNVYVFNRDNYYGVRCVGGP